MKKRSLFTATALSIICFAGQPLMAQAAPANNCSQFSLGNNHIIVSYGSNCNLQDLFDNLQTYFPNCNLPGLDRPGNDKPGTNIPETDIPDTNIPETDIPETNIPDTNIPGTGNGSTEDSEISSFAKQVVSLVNRERAKEGLSALTIDAQLTAAALIRAQECETSFSHTRPDGSHFTTALKEQNVRYRGAGENIAWGQSSPEEVVAAWMNSSGHRANIMNPNFTTIGVGHYENSRGTDYWAQLFTY